ncbi:MAG: hypothetical protein JW839_17365 [Candidatus Lokiarchaeota archaeon]|nr:hypothetical protein [Candidatus Lokiarchaeota archaeon]
MSTRTKTITGAMAAIVIAAICVSSVSAIAPAQVAYSDSKLWAPGRVLTYSLLFNNSYTPLDDDREPVAHFRPTVLMSATVTYNITAVSANAADITETISGFTYNYPFAINASHRPFVAVYNQTSQLSNVRFSAFTGEDSNFTTASVVTGTEVPPPTTNNNTNALVTDGQYWMINSTGAVNQSIVLDFTFANETSNVVASELAAIEFRYRGFNNATIPVGGNASFVIWNYLTSAWVPVSNLSRTRPVSIDQTGTTSSDVFMICDGDSDSTSNPITLSDYLNGPNNTVNIRLHLGSNASTTVSVDDFDMDYMYRLPKNIAETKQDFLLDFACEIHGGPRMNNTFIVARNSVQNITLNVTSSPLPSFVNYVTYYKNNNSVVPQAGHPEITNRFILSSNITGVFNTTTGLNVNGNSSTDKVYAHGLFYTPLSFAGQYGTFWLNTGLDLESLSDMGLWTVSLPGAPDASTYPMDFEESDTFTWHEGQADEAFRWRAKFKVDYPKVGGTEQAKYDSETGILLEYYTKQVRVDWDPTGPEFFEGLHPQYLKCWLISASGITFSANAQPEVPGFPIITLLVALGIGFALVYRKYRK